MNKVKRKILDTNLTLEKMLVFLFIRRFRHP